MLNFISKENNVVKSSLNPNIISSSFVIRSFSSQKIIWKCSDSKYFLNIWLYYLQDCEGYKDREEMFDNNDPTLSWHSNTSWHVIVIRSDITWHKLRCHNIYIICQYCRKSFISISSPSFALQLDNIGKYLSCLIQGRITAIVQIDIYVESWTFDRS